MMEGTQTFAMLALLHQSLLDFFDVLRKAIIGLADFLDIVFYDKGRDTEGGDLGLEIAKVRMGFLVVGRMTVVRPLIHLN